MRSRATSQSPKNARKTPHSEASIEAYAALDHVLVSPRGDTTGAVDRALADFGLKRRIALLVATYLALPAVLAASDLVATVPQRTARQIAAMADIQIMPLAIDLSATVSMAWHRRAASEFQIGYRHVGAPAQDEGFLAARLHFEQKPSANDADVRALLARRRAAQPIGAWSCGSVFTNPPGDHAARLIEAAGLKGYRIGDAAVSQKHANFIVNYGAASAADVEQLIEHVRATVERVHGVRLTPEVRILGERA